MDRIDEKLEKLINNLLKKYIGGETYFDNLDTELLKPDNFDIIQELMAPFSHANIIVSGKFGKWIFDNVVEGALQCESIMHVSGGLRKKGPIYLKNAFNLKETRYMDELIFIDDSYYSGRTKRSIDKWLSFEYGLGIEDTCVVYNGNKDIHSTKALYYYYKDN